MAADNYTTDKVKAKRLKRCSAILFVSSAAQLAIQIAVLVLFKPFYDGVGNQTTWFQVYNGVVIASGGFNLLCSFLMICCFISAVSSSRESGSRCTIFFALTIALLSSIGSTAVSALEIHWIRHSGNHPCQLNTSSNQPNCDLWFDLEVAVAVFAGLSAVMLLIIIIIASMKSKVKQPVPEIPSQRASGEVTVQQVEIITASAAAEEPVSTPLPEETEVEPHPAPVISEESDETPPQLNDDALAYAQQLRKMTRDELEREMALQFQIKFLKELRVEIDRRNLFSTDQQPSSPRSQTEQLRRHGSRRSDASSVTSSVRGASRASSSRPTSIETRNTGVRSVSPPPRQPPPTPDYDEMMV